jgi:diguanylate cyclase (GGDEF)-like protein
LLVEDSRAIASVLAASIGSSQAASCDIAASRAEAEALLAASPSDYFVAVLDLNLPDAPDGEIIELAHRYGIPAVVLTATDDEQVRERMFESGVADYVVKDSVAGIDYVARQVNRMALNRETEVLVVDDSRSFRQFMQTLLQRHGYHIFSAADGVEGLGQLEAHPDIRLVITDYNMPRMDGLAMVREMRKIRSHEELAIICVSENRKEGTVARFLKGGASDYLHKPFCIEEFYCRVDQNVDMLRALWRARDLASRDFLTGLYNRRYFFEHARRLHRRAVAGEIRLLLGVIDADYFKRINDRHGHHVGDEALVAIAGILRRHIDGRGLVARFGGEEFVCLLQPTDAGAGVALLDQLRRDIERHDLFCGDQRVPLSVSIGVTTDPGTSLDTMLAAADDALYRAKDGGRNRIVSA